MTGENHSDLVRRARSHTLGDLLRRTSYRYPDKVAIVDGDLRMTFGQFDNAVDNCAAALASRGLAKGDRLGLLSRNGWEFAALAYAAARLGIVLVPINFMLNSNEIAYILGHAEVAGMVAEEALIDVAQDALVTAEISRAVKGIVRATSSPTSPPPPGWEHVSEWLSERVAPPPQPLLDDDDPLRLMYTSGTESRPKGVMLTSRSLISQYVSCAIDGGMDHDDVDLHTLPLYHCAQLDCFLCVDIYLGATSVILPSPDPAAMLAAIEREAVTKLFCPPTVWIGLLRHPDFDHRDLRSLRKGYYGASAMPVEILKELQERLPRVEFWNFYGQTEMAPVATILRPTEQATHPGSAGRASLNVETRVVDDEDTIVDAGVIGEIVHRSPQATLGYYRDPDKTTDAFRNGWFHSGDLGVMSAEGYLSVVDRKKDMIKTGGENVASREVEEALYELEGVAEVAVFGIHDPRWIEAVAAVIVARPGVSLTEDDVHRHARERLAGYKRPKYVVLAQSLPKNPSGKILKRELRQMHAELSGTARQPLQDSPQN
ncbi:MAG: fatty acyl-CoA synthetase [Propionicimonas sp.]|nr:fatty acyl-CoA synthetase [Propionicimonas sp.]